MEDKFAGRPAESPRAGLVHSCTLRTFAPSRPWADPSPYVNAVAWQFNRHVGAGELVSLSFEAVASEPPVEAIGPPGLLVVIPVSSIRVVPALVALASVIPMAIVIPPVVGDRNGRPLCR